MKFFLFAFIFYITLLSCHTKTSQISIPENEIIQDAKDLIIFNKLVKEFSDKKNLPIGELIIAIGKSFEGTPYVAHTLENGPDEKLAVNLREMDCTTFVENCLALARTIQSDNPSYNNFLTQLQQIRYRNGIRNKYPSRLHYFSEWISNNEKKGMISLPANEFGKQYNNEVNFMSSHPGSYECLKTNPDFISELKKQEENISGEKYYYIPKEEIVNNEAQLKEGDIAGITTNIKGLDIVHTILLTRVNGRIHLLHASSSAKKVVISDEPLANYMANKKIQTGIIVGRPLQ